jgi:hypothetical protein
MKVLILGTGKTGTTVMVYKVSGGLPNCQAFSGGRPGQHIGDYENAVYKHTYEERKGKSFEAFQEHLSQEHYDRMIWMARDPRDAAVSRMLYRWHKGFKGKKKQYEAHLDLVLKKEKDPRALPFVEICRYTGQTGWPLTREQVIEEELHRYQQMVKFVEDLGSDWFLLTFEKMVENDLKALNNYLGFEVQADATVPNISGKAKVIRKKTSGDWRHWFTEEDVDLFKPAFLPYLELIGYDSADWALNPAPKIEPEYSSLYMKGLPRKARWSIIWRTLGFITKQLKKLSK